MDVHTILYVSDQKRSRDFFTDILNLQPTLDVPGMTEFKLSENHVLGLMPENGIRKILGTQIGEFSTGSPRAELYLRVENPRDMHSRSLMAGARELSPVLDRAWGDSAGYVMDFDGHVLAFAKNLGGLEVI